MVPIKNFPVVYISPNHNEKYKSRKIKTEALLHHIGFTNVTHWKSGSDQYPKCLADAFIQILENHLDDEPILIVEDDIGWTGVTHIEVPDGADAIYFGNTISASHPTLDENIFCCVLDEYSDTQMRVYNMLATHAILYISKIYKEKVIYQLKNHLIKHTDIPIARVQKDFFILTNKFPVFFQDDGDNKVSTLVQFNINSGVLLEIREIKL